MIIGIAGGSASGKSTLGRALVERLGERACLIEQDAYYRDQAHLAPRERLRINYDHPDAVENDLLAAHLRALAEGRTVKIPQYDFIRHTRSANTVHMPPREIVLVVGLHVLSVPGVRACLGMGVFVDTAPDIRLARRIRRDVAERGRDVAEVLDQYVRTVRPMHAAFVEPSRRYADMIVHGEMTTALAAERILGILGRPMV